MTEKKDVWGKAKMGGSSPRRSYSGAFNDNQVGQLSTVLGGRSAYPANNSYAAFLVLLKLKFPTSAHLLL